MNYTSGSAISFPFSEAGIGPAASFAPQEGLKPLGPNPNRQDGGHAHSLMFSPTSPRCAETFNYPYFPRFLSIFSRFPLDFWPCSLDSWRPDAENGRKMGKNG